MSHADPRRDFREEKFETFACELGRVILIWNDLHVAIGGIFWALTRIPNGMVPGAIWHSMTVDRTQRKMTADLAKLDAIGHEVPSSLRLDIEWLLKKADAIENDRNNLVHTPFIASGASIMPFHLGQHRRGLQIQDYDPVVYCTRFYDCALALREFADEIERALRRPDSTHPTRPLLPPRPPNTAVALD